MTKELYTAVEDRILWEWVDKNPQQGGGTAGNEIYKQLEKKARLQMTPRVALTDSKQHPQHPWHSWRNRWLKFLKGRPPPSAIIPSSPSRPSHEHRVVHAISKEPSPLPQYQEPTPPKQDNNAHKRSKHRADSSAKMLASKTSGETSHPLVKDLENDAHPVVGRDSPVPSTSSYDTAHTHEESRNAQASYVERPALRETLLRNVGQQGQKRKLSELSRDKLADSPSHSLPRDEHPNNHRACSPHERSKAFSGPGKSPVREMRGGDQHIVHVKEEPQEVTQEVGQWPFNADEQPGKEIEYPQMDAEDMWQNIANSEATSENVDEDLGGLNEDFGSQYEDFATGMEEVMRAGLQYRESTQALFQEATPSVEFDVPPPDGGWGNYENTEAFDDQDFDGDHEKDGSPDIAPSVADTEAIFGARTQSPDLDVPDPDYTLDSLRQSSPPEIPRLQQRAESVASTTELSAQVDDWIRSYAAQGISVETVLAVFKSTSQDSELAEKVLEHIRKGKRKSDGGDPHDIPHDWKGVWTASDDEDLAATDARRIHRLVLKHGTDGKDALRNRSEFLDFLDRL